MKQIKVLIAFALVLLLLIPSPVTLTANAEQPLANTNEVDVDTPKLISMQADKNFLAPGESILFSVQLEDESDIDWTYVKVAPVDRKIAGTSVQLKYNVQNDRYEGSYQVPMTAFNEKWEITFWGAKDIHGNYTQLSSEYDRDTWKSNVTFHIFDGNDVVKPQFSGTESIQISVLETFDALQNVTAEDDIDGDLTSSIQVIGSVDTSKIGSYKLAYLVSDKAGNTMHQERIINVVDLEKPILKGVNDIEIFIGEEFSLRQNVTAEDNYDKDLTDKIKVTGDFYPNKAGVYHVTYTVTDSSGNMDSVKRTIKIKDSGNIVLNGTEDLYLLTNESFDVLDGVTALDGQGVDITKHIQTTGSVNITKAGDYTVTYAVKDQYNKQVTKKRVIHVREKQLPLFIGVDDITLTEGTSFNHLTGVEAYDSFGQRLTNLSTSYGGSLEEPGIHEVQYEIDDRWGQVTKHTRKITVVPTAPYFSDITTNGVYFKQVQVLRTKGIINGYSDGTFKPNNQLTRAHAAVIISKALGLDTKAVTNPNFKDVATTHPYYAQIAAIANAGIMGGKEGKKFDPSGTLTRGQMAVILTNAYKLSGVSKTIFKDVPSTNWSYKYVQVLAANNITAGYADGTFKPESPISRVHFSLFLYKVIEG